MNWRATGVLLAAAAVLFAFVWLVERPIRQERLRQASRVILPGFDPKTVNKIEVKARNGNDIQVEHSGTNSTWQMTAPISYPADKDPIDGLLDALAKLEWQERITAAELKDQTNAQEKFGFTQPQYDLSVQGSAGVQKILVGTFSAIGDQAFLQVVGNPNIYLVGAAFLQLIPFNKDQWRDLSLFDTNALACQSIQVHTPGGNFELERDPTNHLWFMINPVTARADNARIDELLKRLKGVEVEQFVSDDARADLDNYGLQSSPLTPELDLFFWRGSNLTARVEVGAGLKGQTNFAFARRPDPGNVVIVARDAFRPWQAAYTNFLDYHFLSRSPDAIRNINVRSLGEGAFSVRKQTNDQWMVVGTETYPADAILMKEWLASFTNIQTEIVKTVATDFAPYGLAHPVLQYTLQDSVDAGPSNSLLAEVDFGVNASGMVFERRPDETFVNRISPDKFGRLPRAAWQLRDRHIWTFEPSNVVSLTVHELGATRKYLRDPDGEWTFAPGFHGPPLVNWPSLEEGVYRIGHLSAVFWSGVEGDHWKKLGFMAADFHLDFEVKRGPAIETHSIAFGERSPYSYPYASVVQNGRRLFFEFPVDLYENFVERDMTIPAAARYQR